MVQQRKSGKRSAACQYLNIIEIRAAHKAKAEAMGWVAFVVWLGGWATGQLSGLKCLVGLVAG